jgi:hypothetical protein
VEECNNPRDNAMGINVLKYQEKHTFLVLILYLEINTRGFLMKALV